MSNVIDDIANPGEAVENLLKAIGILATEEVNRGGCDTLSCIGKTILENINSGKFKRNVTPWKSPNRGATSFGLNFHEERDKCLKEKRLFEDPEFPACDKSLYYKNRPKEKVVWKRPSEIVDNPHLFVAGNSLSDAVQGSLSNCWFPSSIALLSLREELLARVVPLDQSFTENYAGIFHFQFWRYGEWIDIVIDDLLPAVVKSSGRTELLYMHSATNNEFWTALLEKAFAKLYGCYENLEWGLMTEALEDCTGGLTQILTPKETDGQTLLTILERGTIMGSLFGCLFPPPSNGILGKAGPKGLVGVHAYSITKLMKVKTKSGEQVLVRLRNPWGHTEWNGAWADGDRKWKECEVSEELISRHAPINNDGEFWMPFEDLLREYWRVEVCDISAEVMSEIYQMTGTVSPICGEKTWKEVQIHGSWSLEENTAGGGPEYPRTYSLNPQFGARFTVTNDCVENDGKCNIIVAVLQKYRRELRIEDNVEPHGSDFPAIGLSVYRALSNSSGAQDEQFFRSNRAVATTPGCLKQREVLVRLRIEPGDFIIVPCTESPNFEADFMVRIFVDGKVDAKRLPVNH